MGKTQSGAVWLDPNKTSPFEFYQYWRNVADADVLKCIRMLTFLPLEEIDKMDAWEGSQLNQAKEILAFELTKLVHKSTGKCKSIVLKWCSSKHADSRTYRRRSCGRKYRYFDNACKERISAI